MTRDRVERLVEDLGRLHPDIDSANKEVAARLLRLSDVVERYYGAICDRFEVSLSGLGVLTALARSAPRELTLAELNRDILVTSGGITFVAARLERQGLLTKRSNPADGRAVLVQLTPKGRQVADELIEQIARADTAALGAFDSKELSTISAVLTSLEARYETPVSDLQDATSAGSSPA
ncbi:MAG TPA: MarR family transcriptional regulator [Acidimicrobiales bacterium]|nr:MarR family transcriptional regulator [Acidimicrobiales bacterium]